jgi:hypothetical protein
LAYFEIKDCEGYCGFIFDTDCEDFSFFDFSYFSVSYIVSLTSST